MNPLTLCSLSYSSPWQLWLLMPHPLHCTKLPLLKNTSNGWQSTDRLPRCCREGTASRHLQEQCRIRREVQQRREQDIHVEHKQVSDMTNEEFRRHYTGNKITPGLSSTSSNFTYQSLAASDIPTRMDWREQQAVTPIKDQGRCGK